MESNGNDFLIEKIKERPINRKKLVRRIIITVSMAVIFGFVACLTFFLLEPVFSSHLNPEEEPILIEFPEEISTEEVLPEDMFETEEDMALEKEISEVPVQLPEDQIEQVLSNIELDSKDYESMYSSLAKIASENEGCLVTVSALTEDTDWWGNSYERAGISSGIIVADNGRELLILSQPVSADRIQVEFCDKCQVEAKIKGQDKETGYMILSVSIYEISADTRKVFQVARIGSSLGKAMVGKPVIAAGSPMGISNSVNYGIITSNSEVISQVDRNYKLLSTNIYGSSKPSGVLFNLNGEVVGFIDNRFNASDRGQLLSAVGITELKRVIERLSNGEAIPYFGVKGTDVTVNANETLGVPFGAYITQIEMDSPAMQAGIQSGDVITGMGDNIIENFSSFSKILYEKSPDTELNVTLMRQSPEGYTEMEVMVTLQ